MGSSVKELLRNGPKPWLKIIAESVDIVDFKVLGDIGTTDQILRKNSSNVLEWSDDFTEQDFAFLESTPFTTQLTTLQPAATFATSSLTLGKYKIEYSFEMLNATAGQSVFAEIQHTTGGVTVLANTFQEFPAANWILSGGLVVLSGLSGVNTFTFFIKLVGSGTAEIRKTRMVITQIA